MEMNKERYNQIIDEAYNNYVKTSKPTLDGKYISQPEFIFWVKTNDNFSKKCGLKIEERELTYDEKVHEARRRFGFELEDGTRTFDINKTETIKFLQSTQRIISLTYNNETIEVYE